MLELVGRFVCGEDWTGKRVSCSADVSYVVEVDCAGMS